ncbi:MBL fold metallo-hydrolase [Aurantibacter sp.]|uniref:ComEC/Rec2 family competence protein n=1 Tax=Aurantibacter sp. TaxID=2807103 RepID=UPI003266C58B
MKKGIYKNLIVLIFLILVGQINGQTDGMKVHVIDIGQGSATLLEFPCGVALIDVGGEDNLLYKSEDEIKFYLYEFFNRRTDLNNTIDLLVVSHPHIDHTRALINIFKDYKIKNVITNGQEKGSGKAGQKYVHEFIRQTERTEIEEDNIGYFESRNSRIPNTGFTNKIISPIKCSVLSPEITLLWGRIDENPNDWSTSAFDNQNNHSVVLKIKYGDSSILLTGDLEDEGIEKLLEKYGHTNILDVDMYLVGHHGSYNGTTPEFLKKMTPEIAILSFGKPEREIPWTAWQYGHPRKSLIVSLENAVTGFRSPKKVLVANKPKKFKEFEITKAVYGTGWDGDLVFETSSEGWLKEYDLKENLLIKNNNFVLFSKDFLNNEDSLQNLQKLKFSIIKDELDDRVSKFFYNKDSLPNIGPATMTRIRARLRGEN